MTDAEIEADAALAVAEALRKAALIYLHIAKVWESDVDDAILALANQDHLAEVQALRAERDEWQEEVGKCIMACKPGPEGFRTSPASAGVYKMRQALEAAEAEVARLKAALHEIADMDGLADWQPETAACVNIARAALTPKGDTP